MRTVSQGFSNMNKWLNKRTSIILLNLFFFSICLMLNSCGVGSGKKKGAQNLPSSPASLTARAGDGFVTLKWDSVTDAVSYNLYMSSVSGVTKGNYTELTDGVKQTSVTSPFKQINLTNGKTYYFIVTAVNNNGESDESNEVSETPGAGKTALAVAIDLPVNLTTVAASPLTVSGVVSDSSAAVTVNGVAANVSLGKFEVPGITITEGMNTIVARAIDSYNEVATASVNISLDSTPPHVAIKSPPDGYTTSESSITVTGTINDIVRGTVNESQGKVLVNDNEAVILNRNFTVETVPLNAGVNTITAKGSDQWGNTASASIAVTRDTTPRRTIKIESGNNQGAPIRTALTNPLVVSLKDENNLPIKDVPVVFRVVENNGTIYDTTINAGARAAASNSDNDGLARALFTVGTWAGAGSNRIEATAAGVEGKVIFTASGTQKPPHAIYVAQGNQQRGAVNHLLPEPLVTYVTDDGHNPLENIPVIFKAVEGGGHFPNGLNTITVKSDSDGRSAAAFILGSTAGNDSNIVEATFDGNTNPTAGFTATGLISGDPGDTRISGVVLDNSNNPIKNVTMRVEGTTREALTDAQGQFVINNVPVGPVHLIADGTTAGTPGVLEYPTLMYDITTIAGADNSTGMPVYLVPLDLVNSKIVGGKDDVTYTIPEVPGFLLTIKANSATFPNGEKQGRISVTQVHADKVPMVPQIGQQPSFIVTIQPIGTVFDPPAPITIPNVDGLAPGEKTNMYSFDHDLGLFVSIGTGTISEDGTLIVSDPGVGVVKAGWHCGGNPAPAGSANNCPECKKCDNNRCVTDANGVCSDDKNSCTDDKCQGGACVHLAKQNGTACDDNEACTSNDRCTATGCKGDKAPNGTACDDGQYCTKDDKCTDAGCKGDKVPDNTLSETNVSLGAVNNILQKVQTWLDLLQIKGVHIPEFQGQLNASDKLVCCETRQGAMTHEVTWGGNLVLNAWESPEFRPTIPPWSGDYTVSIFGRRIGVAYGIFIKATLSGQAGLSRTKRECQGDVCWSGSLGVDASAVGGIFGEVPNPALPSSCGPNKDRTCNFLRVDGAGTTGLNLQSSVGCDKVSGQLGHNGFKILANFILAEGTWFELSLTEAIPIIEPGPIGPFSFELPI